MAYERVNAAWPEGTRDGRDLKPTAQEAVAACRRLYRFATKKPWHGRIKAVKGKATGGFTTMTVKRRGRLMVMPVIEVNPDRWGGGWHEVVHMMSHYLVYRLHPGVKLKPHGPQHHWLEMQMVDRVVKSGWLTGGLKRPEKPPVDRAAARRALSEQRTMAGIKRWQTKQRRAETAIRKLQRRAKRLGIA